MNELKNMSLEQEQQILLGLNVKKTKDLSQQEIEKMQKDYIGMYYALTSINWSQGMTLGMAWQKALEQMDAFVASKTKMINHPMNKHLSKIHSEFRKKQSERIMTSEYAECKLNPVHKKSFLDYGTKRVKDTKDSLNNLYQKYMPEKTEVNNQQKSHSFDLAKQKAQFLMQQIMLQQMKNSRAA
nr:hypothetical protein [Candidatus Enterousia merdequi]